MQARDSIHVQSMQPLDCTSDLQEAMDCVTGLLAVDLVRALFTKQCSCVLLAFSTMSQKQFQNRCKSVTNIADLTTSSQLES